MNYKKLNQTLGWLVFLISTAVYFMYLKDSPRNMLLHNNEKEARKIIKDMIAPLHNNISEVKITEVCDYLKTGNNLEFENDSLSCIFEPFKRRTTIILMFTWFSNSFLSYGPLIIYTKTIKSLNISSDSNIILSIIVIGLISLTSNIIFPLLVEVKFLSIKKMLISSNVISGVFAMLIIFVPKYIQFWLCLYMYFTGNSFNMSTTYSTLIYPTKVRDNAIGFLYSCTRLGGFTSQFVFLWLFDIGVFVPYYMMTVCIGLITITNLFLPLDPYGDESLDREMKS